MTDYRCIVTINKVFQAEYEMSERDKLSFYDSKKFRNQFLKRAFAWAEDLIGWWCYKSINIVIEKTKNNELLTTIATYEKTSDDRNLGKFWFNNNELL